MAAFVSNLPSTPAGEIDQLDFIDNELEDPTFNRCLVEEIKSKRYPASNLQGQLISHKFNFYRQDEKNLDFSQ